MIWVDYCILGIIGLSVVVGALRGFARDVLGTSTWILALLAAYLFGSIAGQALSSQIPTPAVRIVAGYALVFFGALFIGALLTHLVAMLIQSAGAGGVDRTMGAGFGLLRGLFVVVVIVMLAGTSAVKQDRWWRESRLIPPVVPLADALRTQIPERWLALLKPDLKSSSLDSVSSEFGTDAAQQTAARPAGGT